MKRIAIVPLCYLPPKGYFDVLHDVELALVDAGAHYVQTDTPFQARIHGRFGAESLVVPQANTAVPKAPQAAPSR